MIRAQLIELTADRRSSSPEGRIGEHRLHQVLAIVEGALDGDVAHIGGRDRRHLAALHLGDAALGMQDEDIDPVAGPRQASIAAEPVSPEVAPTMVTRWARSRQQMVEEPADELQRHILEGQGRPVEQLQEPGPGVDLLQRRHRLMAEIGIGVPDQAGELRLLDPPAEEGLHDPRRQIRIIQPDQ